jgi:hypothetical protein
MTLCMLKAWQERACPEDACQENREENQTCPMLSDGLAGFLDIYSPFLSLLLNPFFRKRTNMDLLKTWMQVGNR